ncbi:MAG: hypothetical protein Pg6B_09010 [Candidatus Azobacteroides pseudotrichonymphae]|jgi:hypothetical protein|nr:MAG: hypothetical protein Pg6B_09010 [Candidatus Azobacteroides pseudotrichonymphae]
MRKLTNKEILVTIGLIALLLIATCAIPVWLGKRTKTIKAKECTSRFQGDGHTTIIC